MPNVRTITHGTITDTLAGWSARTKIPAATLAARLNAGWEVARALSAPPDRRFARGGRKSHDAERPCPPMKKHPRKGTAFARWWDRGVECSRHFGPWGSDEARRRYREFALLWASGGVLGTVVRQEERPLVADLIVAWLAHCAATYRKRGKVTSEVHCCRAAVKHLNELYGEEDALEFDAQKLAIVREAMITEGWVRKTVNDHVARIVRAFAWGVTQKLAPLAVHQELALVEPLVAGRRADLDESDPVDPVPAEHIAAVLAGEHLHPNPRRREVLAAMIRVQLLTGMRPGELCSLRAEQIDRRKEPWRCELSDYNKMLHKDVTRVVFFGPQARAILAPLLVRAGGECLFRFPPWRKKALWSPITPVRYRNRIRLACLSAKVPVWTPNQLRHNRATEVMDRYESDQTTAAVLGNSPEVARQVYAARAGESVARRVAEATG